MRISALYNYRFYIMPAAWLTDLCPRTNLQGGTASITDSTTKKAEIILPVTYNSQKPFAAFAFPINSSAVAANLTLQTFSNGVTMNIYSSITLQYPVYWGMICM